MLRRPIRQKVIDKEKNREYIGLQQAPADLTETQKAICAAMDQPGMQVDDIIRRSGLPAAAVLSELMMMQILGYVAQEPGKRFSLRWNQK